MPDIAGWRRERVPDDFFDSAAVSLVPDWVCEVLSDSTRAIDRVKKQRIYHCAGVFYVWHIDPEARTFEVFRREADQALLEPLLRDKRPDVLASTVLASISLLGGGAAEAVAELILRRAADISTTLWRAAAHRPAMEGTTVTGETLGDFVAWASARPDVEILCDVTSPARAGRLRAKISDRVTLINGIAQPALFGDVAPHFARTFGVAIFAPASDRVSFVEPGEAAKLWQDRIRAEGRALIAP